MASEIVLPCDLSHMIDDNAFYINAFNAVICSHRTSSLNVVINEWEQRQ